MFSIWMANNRSTHAPNIEVVPCLKSNCQSWYIDILHYGMGSFFPPTLIWRLPKKYTFSRLIQNNSNYCSTSHWLTIITTPMTFAYATHFYKCINPCFRLWLCICFLGWYLRVSMACKFICKSSNNVPNKCFLKSHVMHTKSTLFLARNLMPYVPLRDKNWAL